MPVSETGALTAWRHPNKMAGIGRLEHPRAVLETAALPVKLYPCMMVMPAGLEPSITSLRGLRPDQLDEGTKLEIRAGLEPVIAAVKGLCPNHLDERTVWREAELLAFKRRRRR